LSPEVLRRIQRDLENTKFLFLDEMSMIGLRLFAKIDFRLRQIFPQNNNRPFGGVFVVLFGDFGQLPPVGDRALYHTPNETESASVQLGSRLYKDNFRKSFHLTQQMRQRGQSEQDIKFATVLSNLRFGTVTKDDWRFLQSRVLSQLTAEEQEKFRDSVILFAANKDVMEKNISMLEAIGTPVCRIEAQYHGISKEEGSRIKSEYCYGLEDVLYLSVGCQVCIYLIQR